MTSPTSPDSPAPDPLVESPSVAPKRCLNCGALIAGRFCAECGQQDRDPRPTTEELLHDVAGELFNWDGKLLGTLRLLVTKPGVLTSEILAGRRARYLPPLRLYLICSVLFFFLSAVLPNRNPMKVRFTKAAPAKPIAAGKPVGSSAEEKAKADAAEACRRAAADSAGGSMAVKLSARAACRAQEGSDAYMPEVSSYYPKVGFVLLPIYALILSLVYRHRRYPEHLYFALHIHAFAFLALVVWKLLVASSVRLLVAYSGLAALLYILIYSMLAQRRVYGGTMLMTAGKTVVIGVVYAVAFLLAVTVAALVALLN